MNDFHIRPFSQCVNAGDPNFADLNEVDIDGQCRLMIGETIPRVDIGADEIGWPKADYNRDEAINFTDFTILTSSWLTIDPNAPSTTMRTSISTTWLYSATIGYGIRRPGSEFLNKFSCKSARFVLNLQ